MCGYVGFTNTTDNANIILKKMMERIRHRGPDGEGQYIDEGIALGHRRLSIIDIDSGAQPMYNEDGSLVIVFNGEIYNYRELKNILKRNGYKFESESDSEVALVAFIHYGPEFVNKLNGIFSIAIYDEMRNMLYLFRDHFGIKPLYYGIFNNIFIITFIFQCSTRKRIYMPKIKGWNKMSIKRTKLKDFFNCSNLHHFFHL